MRMHMSRFTASVWAAVASALTAAAALAQTPAPQPTIKNAPPVWVGYLLMAVLMIIVIGISLLPSKRSHQD